MEPVLQPRTLHATTCLGENTAPILRDLVAGLRSSGLDVVFDESLDFAEREAAFRNGHMDLVWACGLLTVSELRAGLDMEVIAAPVFAGVGDATYSSVVIVRADESRSSDDRGEEVGGTASILEGRLAVNEYGSWSGYVGYERWLRTRGLDIDDYRTVVLTGSHRNSIQAVADGVADLASIDETMWRHVVENEADLAGRLRVFDETDRWPAPPFVVRDHAVDADQLRAAAGATVGLDAVVEAEVGDYADMLG